VRENCRNATRNEQQLTKQPWLLMVFASGCMLQLHSKRRKIFEFITA